MRRHGREGFGFAAAHEAFFAGRAIVVAAQVQEAVHEIERQFVVRTDAIRCGIPPGRFGAA